MENLKLLQNVSSFSAEFHTHGKYKRFYNQYADQLSGFSGIWTFCCFAGQALTNVEPKHGYDDGWIETVTAFVQNVLDAALKEYVGDIQNLSWLEPLARKAVEVHAVPLDGPRFCVELVERRKEDGWRIFLDVGEKESWTAHERGDMDNVRFFDSKEEASARVGEMAFKRGEKVFVHEYDDRDGMVQTWQVNRLNRDGLVGRSKRIA
jgi:hypothetical protein